MGKDTQGSGPPANTYGWSSRNSVYGFCNVKRSDIQWNQLDKRLDDTVRVGFPPHLIKVTVRKHEQNDLVGGSVVLRRPMG